jgi:hypothetical protein
MVPRKQPNSQTSPGTSSEREPRHDRSNTGFGSQLEHRLRHQVRKWIGDIGRLAPWMASKIHRDVEPGAMCSGTADALSDGDGRCFLRFRYFEAVRACRSLVGEWSAMMPLWYET